MNLRSSNYRTFLFFFVPPVKVDQAVACALPSYFCYDEITLSLD